MDIVPFRQEDRKQFVDFCTDFHSAQSTIKPFSEEFTTATFNYILEGHENVWGYMLKDKISGENIGYALISSYWCNEVGGNILVLDELYISPKSRHNGYASLFLKWVEEHFKNYAKEMTLEVLTTNQSAQSIYRKDGLSPDGFVTYTKSI